MVTGLTVQPFEWETQTNKLFLLLSFLVMVSAWLAANQSAASRRALGAAGVIASTLLVVHAVAMQAVYYRAHHEVYAALGDELAPVLAWLREATPADAVVLANPALPVRSALVGMYAGRFTFVSEPSLAVSLIPQQEIEDRYLLAMAAFGFGEEGLRQVVRHNRGGLLLGTQAPGDAASDVATGPSVQRLAQRYRRLLGGTEPLPPSPFRVDYIVAARAELARLRADVVGRPREVYGNEAFVILGVRP